MEPARPDEPKTFQGLKPTYDWDFFLAHAGVDLSVAQDLYAKLSPPAKVFLDDVSLLPGDNWDEVLPSAQRSSLISVVIVSPNTEKAYYQREEIAAAIDMARQDPSTHRVVPVYFNSQQISRSQIPYGLRLKHSLNVPETGDLTSTGERLLKTLAVMKQYEVKKDRVVAEQRLAVARITNSQSNAEILAGFNEVTKFVRPLLFGSLVVFVLLIVLLVVCLFIPSDVRGLLSAVLGSFCAITFAFMMWLTSVSLKYAPQIAQGRINGG